MSYGAKQELVKLGYTHREAHFVLLVGRYSGFFLRRQFNRFLNRKNGAMCQNFLRRAVRLEHAAELKLGQTHIYHFRSRTLYRVLGDEDSSFRRIAGDQEIKTRLMVLDYVLDRIGDRFLMKAQEKVDFFAQQLHLDQEALPEFSERFPITITSDPNGKMATLGFTYFDHGARSVSAFEAFLARYLKVFHSLSSFTLIYAADSALNFAVAAKEFHRHFPSDAPEFSTPELAFGVEHLLRYFHARVRNQKGTVLMREGELELLSQGDRLYEGEGFDELHESWLRGQISPEEIRQQFAKPTVKSEFKTLQLSFPYPGTAPKNRGIEL